MTEFSQLRIDPSYVDEAGRSGLMIPEMHVGKALASRMFRCGRTLDISEDNLLSGSTEIQLDVPVPIYFDSRVQDTADPARFDTALSITWPERHCTYPAAANLAIHPNVSASAAAEGAYRKMNAAFWTGVLAVKALQEPAGASRLDMEYHELESPANRLISFNPAFLLRRRMARKVGRQQYPAYKYRKEGRELAEQYPVITQGYIHPLRGDC